MTETNNIWDFQRMLTGRLTGINMINFNLGQRLAASDDDFKRGVGTQAVGWSIINLGIALFGNLGARRRLDQLEAPNELKIQRQEAKQLRRILSINAPLNFLYMFGGYLLARRNHDNAFMRGNGWGVIAQGFILLLFDTFHLRRVTQVEQDLLKAPADDQ